MEFFILVFIGASYTGIVFVIGRLACPRHDRVPLSEVDYVIAWTTIRRGIHAISSYGPVRTTVIDDTSEGQAT